MIDDMAINFWSYGNFAKIEDIYIWRKCNLILDLLKFISNKKKILSEIVVLSYNQVFSQTLSFYQKN